MRFIKILVKVFLILVYAWMIAGFILELTK
jgi:hypothetical protein